MTSMFESEEARARIDAWYERFLARCPADVENRRVPTRFGETSVLTTGPVGAPDVVLLHGALASAAHLLGELAGLSRQFRVHAVDIVGQSVRSAETRVSVANDDYGHWLRDVLDGLELPRAHVVAVSLGGFVAIRLAVVAPERIDHLALLVPAGMVSGPVWAGFTRIGLPMMAYRMAPSPRRLDALVRHLLTTHDDDWKPYLGDAFRSYTMNMSIPKRATVDELRGFERPTLVVAADRDVSFPGEKVLARARELFPRLVDEELLEDTLHSPPTTDAFRAWLAERIGGFLRDGAIDAPVAPSADPPAPR